MKTLGALQAAVTAAPSDLAARTALAQAFLEREEHESAVREFRCAIDLDADAIGPRLALARGLEALGRCDEAISELRHAIALKPSSLAAWQQLAELLSIRLDRPADALSVFEDAAHRLAGAGRLNLEFAVAFLTAAAGCPADEARGLTDPLEASQGRVAAFVGSTLAQLARAIAVARHGRYDEARACCEEILDREPTLALAQATLGHVDGALGDVEAGRRRLQEAMRMAPGDAIVQGLYLRQLLWCGDFEAAADRLSDCGAFLQMSGRTDRQRLWSGQPLEGKTLLVHARAGLGDTFNFIRAAGWWRDQGAVVLVETRRTIVEIVGHAAGVSDAFAPYDKAVTADYELDLAWSWLHERSRLGRIGDAVPYIQLPPPLVDRWRRRLAATRGVRVGLVWAGEPVQYSPFHTRQSRRNAAAYRSIPPEALAPLTRIPGVHLFSLQVGQSAATAAARAFDGGVVDLAADVEPFIDTAAAMAALDIVVSVDTASAHLAGALGKPVLVLLPSVACWRWLTDRSDSPWYPTARLIRQRTPGDWRGAIVEAVAALERMAATDRVEHAAAPAAHTG